MLVYSTAEHDARVLRSARSLGEAGYEVIVLGVTRDGRGERRSEEEIDLRLLPRRDRVAERKLSTAARAVRLKGPVKEAGEKIRDLQRRLETAGSARLADRARLRLYRSLRSNARRRFDRARAEAREARRAKIERDDRDPLELESYVETWWRAVRRLRPDVVHVHDAHGVAVARRAAARGARWVFDAHEDPLKKSVKRSHWEAAIVRTVGEHVRHADAVITVSPALANRLRETFGVEREPVVVYNAPPLQALGDAVQPGLRAGIGLGPDVPLLVYVGSTTRWHRLSVALEALRRLPAVHLALVVSPTNRFVAETVALAEETGVSSRVHVLPKVPPDGVSGFIGDADVGIFPILRYRNADVALPNKLFEYLHAGLPVVVSDAPAMADFVRRHRLGEAAPADDPDAWTAAIERLLAGSPSRGREEEWEALKQEWCWDRQAERLVEVYGEVLRSAPPGGSLSRG